VDDEETVRGYLCRVLDAVYTVHAAADVPAAEAILRAHPIDAILCDHRMPGECGIEFLTRLRRSHPRVARILITGWTDRDMLLDSINESAVFRYLVKPIRPESVQQAVADALAHGPDAVAGGDALRSTAPEASPLTAAEGRRAFGALSAVAFGLTTLLAGAALLAVLLFLIVYVLKCWMDIDLVPSWHLRDVFTLPQDAP
jgi:CheY-like chemotaxis protein